MPDTTSAITLRGTDLARSNQRAIRLLDLQSNEKAYLISIAPIPFRARHKHMHAIEVKDPKTGQMVEQVSNFRDYYIPAAERGSFQVIEITDAFIRTITPSANSANDVAAAPVPARQIAQSLVTEWALNGIDSNPVSCWGLAVIDGPEPTQKDLEELTAIQTAYCEQGCSRAQQEYMSGNGARFITNLHRTMAAWLGAADKYDWCGFVNATQTRSCVACRQPIAGDATFHAGTGGCGQNLLEYIHAGNITLADVRKQDPWLADRYVKYADRRRKAEASSQPEIPPLAEPPPAEEATA